jgi:uncharacterized membrane protein
MSNNSNLENQNSFVLTKQRLEALSDGVFAIVMTLLVIEIKVPEKIEKVNTAKLIDALLHEKSLFISYFLTFAIISVLWQAHHFLFNNYAKNINRWVIVLNTTFLSIISLIPFSSHFLGVYFDQPVAVIVFGLNTLFAYILIRAMNLYILNSKEIQNHDVELRIRRQASFRSAVNFVFTILGIGAAFLNTYLAIFLFLIPVLFNFIPGLLNALEKLFGFEL